MECVISPWWFYAMSVCDSVSTIAAGVWITLLVIAAIGVFALPILLIDCVEIADVKPVCKWCFIAFIVTTLIMIIVPSKEVLIQMLIAKNVTYDLVGQTVNIVEQVYSDIMSLFN